MSLKPREILVVDLDGTLLRSDMLFESFWSAFGRDWRSLFLSVAALTGGRASLKRHLAVASAVNVLHNSGLISVLENLCKSDEYSKCSK